MVFKVEMDVREGGRHAGITPKVRIISICQVVDNSVLMKCKTIDVPLTES